MKIEDYNAKLHEDITDISDKVRRDMLPLVARFPTMEAVVDAYITDHDEYFEELRRQAEADGRRGENAVPIAYRNTGALHRMADLVLHEELTWSHPDKMSIVEYPVLSERQRVLRDRDRTLLGVVEYGDRQHNGRKKTHFTDEQGGMRVNNPRMANGDMDVFEDAVGRADLSDVVEASDLTGRQKEALFHVYVNDSTQADVAEAMGVNQRTVNEHLSKALRKIRSNCETEPVI